MKKMSTFLFFLLVVLTGNIYSQKEVSPRHYCVYFTDKKDNGYSIDHPENFLSERALARRKKSDIEIIEQDLPITKRYVDSLTALGFQVKNTSKWLNCAIIFTKDKKKLEQLSKLSFIKKNIETEKIVREKSKKIKYRIPNVKSIEEDLDTLSHYGLGANQIEMLNGHILHSRGYQGDGIVIAVLDAGFYKVDELSSFDSLWANHQILGWYDYVDLDTSVFDADTHGMQVLSTIGANIPNKFVGTAPKAKFWLFRTEQSSSEYMIEEYNWITAAERADSLGVDMIHSSLGYNDFDDDNTSYTYEDMDGNTAISTVAADIAASKGIIVVTSAGNSGNDEWQYITAPADADSILTIGAVTANGKYAYFSSMGPTFDQRVKPDVVAQGLYATVQGANDKITTSNGTSFSGPIIAGMVASLWQAFPQKTNMEIINAIKMSGNQYIKPDDKLGFGIPNFNFAYLYLKGITFEDYNSKRFFIFPNPFQEGLNIEICCLQEKYPAEYQINIFNLGGVNLCSKNISLFQSAVTTFYMEDFAYLDNGTYILQVISSGEVFNQLIVKE